MDIKPLAAFEDNYIWLIRHFDRCIIVDPGDEEPVFAALEKEKLHLEAILITHHHGDHTGGIAELKSAYPQAQLFAPALESIQCDHPLKGGETLHLLDQEWSVLFIPGHTRGHLAYLSQNALFCGDTLFSGGCGRVFSGTLEQLAHSLQLIAALPPETQIYCAHEYTLANLGFALWVEPNNTDIQQRFAEEKQKRQSDQPTVPSRLALELKTNPFLRTDQPSVIKAASNWAGRMLDDPVDVFKALRQWKDQDYD